MSIRAEPQTIAEAITRQAADDPERTAIVCHNLPVYTFRQLSDTISRIGDDLHASGIGAASRVGVVLPRGPEAAVIAIAVCAHAIGFPIDATLSAAEFEFEFTRSDLDALVLPAWTDSPAAVAARSRSMAIFHASKAARSLTEIGLTEVVEVGLDRRRSGAPATESVSVIQTSSGSTGIPKLILVTHANLFDVAKKLEKYFLLTKNDRCASIQPIHSGFGFKISLLAPLLTGGSIALARSSEAKDVSIWSSDLNPTWFVATPTVLRAALDQLRSTPAPKHSLRFFASTSAYLPDQVRVDLEAALGVPALEFYGLREAGIVVANPAPPAMRKPGSAGLIAFDDVAIVNDRNETLPRGAEGAVGVRGQGLTPGYIEALPAGSDRLSRKTSSPESWVLTGDLGAVDEDNFLWIVGRTKEIINRGGDKISPYEVEKVLLQHSAVRDAGVFGVPHPRLGENVAAAVVLHPGLEATPNDIRQFLFGRLAASKIPQKIIVLDEMPRGITGKTDRRRLSVLFADQTAGSTAAQSFVPPQNDTESYVLNVWRRLLKREDIGVTDNFFDAGGDSLLAEQMLLEVEAVLPDSIPKMSAGNVSTVRALAAAGAAGVSPKFEAVTCARDAGGIPFFFCHGDFETGGVYVRKLVQSLGEDQTVFVVHPWPDTDEKTSIEGVAQAYAPQLAALYPSGPFRIGGRCNGGLLAWALAHELRKMGRRVELIALIDAMSFNARPAFRGAEKAVRVIQGLVPSKFGEKLGRHGMQSLWSLSRHLDQRDRVVMLATKKLFPSRRTDQRPKTRADVECGRYYNMMSKYVPPEIDCTLVCLVCSEYWRRLSHSQAPWRNLVRQVYVEQFSGLHSALTSETVSDMATRLRGYLVDRRCSESVAGKRDDERAVHR